MSNRLKDISYGIAAQESAGMHKLAKMLLERPFSRERLKMQALRYLITPQQLSRRQAHKYGWLAVVPIHWLAPDKRAELVQEIRRIEADKSLPPYERVGKIVSAVKQATGMKFVNDSAFRTMMNTKYNEYVLAERLDEIHSVEDALRVLREADVAAKPTTVLGAQPEMFTDNRLTSLNSNQTSASILLGGHPHQSAMKNIADYAQEVLRLRTKWFCAPGKNSSSREEDLRRIAGEMRDLSPQNRNVQRAGEMVLTQLRMHMPHRVSHITNSPGLDPTLGSFGQCKTEHDVLEILRKAFQNKQDLCGFFNSHVALRAVANSITTNKLMVGNPRFDPTEQRRYEDWILRQISFDKLRQPLWNDPLMDVVKKLKVDNASSYDTLLVNMARYPNERRQPMVFAIDRLLSIDENKDEAAWRREAAIILKGASSSLLPSNLALLAPNEALRSETREAVNRSIGGEPPEDKEPSTWLIPGGTAGFYTPSGMPTVIGLPVGAEDVGRASMEQDSAFAMDGGNRPVPALRNREALLQFSAKHHIDYKSRHAKVTVTTTGVAKPVKKKGHINDKPDLRLSKFKMLDMAVLGSGETNLLTPAQAFVQLTANRADEFKQGNRKLDVKEQVALMNFTREDLNAKDAFGNSALHEALRLAASRTPSSSVGDDFADAYQQSGASYAVKNFFGVPLAEVLPMPVGGRPLQRLAERQRVARADVIGENLMSAMGGGDESTPEEEPASDAGFAL